jgi:glutamate/tyrosine decarboxylase-like PLP-dependent enzyme
MREILLEMYEKLWEADKDKYAWNVILKDTLEKTDVIQQDPNEALMRAAEKYKEEIHPDSAYGQWMKRFNPQEK